MEHREKLEITANLLMEKEKISGEVFKAIMSGEPLPEDPKPEEPKAKEAPESEGSLPFSEPKEESPETSSVENGPAVTDLPAEDPPEAPETKPEL